VNVAADAGGSRLLYNGPVLSFLLARRCQQARRVGIE